MLNWELWENDAAGWDATLTRFADHSVTQGYGWGEHKKHSGWVPVRMAAKDDGRTVAMAQILMRRYPLGAALAWVSGGPVGEVAAWGEAFRAAVRSATGGGQLYCRINPTRELSAADSAVLGAASWARPVHPMLSGKSILLDLAVEDEEWLRSINAKHRYYVRKSAGAALNWIYGNTQTLRRDMVALTRRLSEEKGMDLQERDAEALESLSWAMPGQVQILVGYAGPEPVTGCLVLIQGAKAHYTTAATVGSGRRVSAAYSMFAKLRRLLHEEKIKELDFGGIHPGSDTATGVDHFKRGFGGREISYLGEWDWATSVALRRIANYFIRRRVGGM